jgi:hypothetical protein
MYNRYPSSVKITSDDIAEKLDKLKANTGLQPYDSNLVNSFADFYKSKGYLTDRQYAILNKVYEANSNERMAELQNWRDNFTEEMKNNFRVCCEYYDKTGYFGSIVSQWKNDKDYIPTKSQYEKMCCNTYAKKVVDNHSRPTAFNNGDLVQLRANWSMGASKFIEKGSFHSWHNSPDSKTTCIVIDNKVVQNDLHRYCKVFVLSHPDIIMLVREKDLKQYRGGK